jgi:hypothetical protein
LLVEAKIFPDGEEMPADLKKAPKLMEKVRAAG